MRKGHRDWDSDWDCSSLLVGWVREAMGGNGGGDKKVIVVVIVHCLVMSFFRLVEVVHKIGV